MAQLQVYPTFDIPSLEERCKKDISEFMESSHTTSDHQFVLKTSDLNTKADLETAILPMKSFIHDNLSGKSYVEGISTVADAGMQKELWIARTFLFYQLMIFVVVILSNIELYAQVFGSPDGKTVFEFRPDITPELGNYQMGIFGSKTPTSDIDVGVQYIGHLSSFAGLAYMISAFENVFLKLTEKSSLDFDIEPYADMYLYKGVDGSDYFYLNIGKLDVDGFKKILPVAGQSIARNVLMDNHNLEIESFPTFQEIAGTVNTAINTSLDDKKYADFLEQISDQAPAKAALDKPEWLTDSMTKMKNFLEKEYDGRREMYYASVTAGETLKNTYAPTFDAATQLSMDKICELIIALGEALSYRMESYTASPTITHIVRILQANPTTKSKYATKSPEELCVGTPSEQAKDPYCTIGKFGFIISMLEQMGYMYRFYNHYCVPSQERDETMKATMKTACEKKIKKYGDRYNHAFGEFMKVPAAPAGGKRGRRKRGSKRKPQQQQRRTVNKRKLQQPRRTVNKRRRGRGRRTLRNHRKV